MKKITPLLLAILFIGISTLSLAQSHHFRIAVGQNYTTNTDIDWYGTGSYSYQVPGYSESYEFKTPKFYNSTAFGFAWTRLWPSNFGFDLGLEYQKGWYAELYHEQYESLESTNPDVWERYSYTSSLKMNNIQLNPSLIYQMETGKFFPYGRLGIIAAYGEVLYKDEESYSYGTIAEGESETTYDDELGVLSLGARIALGTDYRLSNLVRLFGEMHYSSNKLADIDDLEEKYRSGNIGIRIGVKFTPGDD